MIGFVEALAASIRLAELGVELHKVSIEGTDPAVRTELLKIQIEFLKMVLADVQAVRVFFQKLHPKETP